MLSKINPTNFNKSYLHNKRREYNNIVNDVLLLF